MFEHRGEPVCGLNSTNHKCKRPIQ